MIWCEPRVIITINKVVTGRFAPGKTDNITNGYAKIQKIIQKDCRNAENLHCIFRIFAVTTRAPAGDSNIVVSVQYSSTSVTARAPAGDSNLKGLGLQHFDQRNSSRPCGGQQRNLPRHTRRSIWQQLAPLRGTATSCKPNLHIGYRRNSSRPYGGQQKPICQF